MDDGKFRLETRRNPNNGRFEVKVDGRWRFRKGRWDVCFLCWCDGQEVELEYWGILTPDGTTNFWGQCPRCEHRETVEWVGKPKEKHHGIGHGWLRTRRANDT